MLLTCVTDGVGYIVTVKLIGFPVHPSSDRGVTIIVPVIFEVVPLAGAAHEGILPVPDAPKPMDVLLFVHENIVPVRLLTKTGTAMVKVGHTAILLIGVTVGVGYIVTAKFIGVPIHPFFEGVTVIVPVIFEPVAFEGAIHELILPVPDAPKPICVLLFVHV
jgi:hypothetical protein